MALLPDIIKPLFPNVPQLPGVPQLLRSPLFPTLTEATLGQNAPQDQLWQSAESAPQWGIFDQDLNQVVFPDSVLDFDNRNQYQVSNFPIQKGKFASYNKVHVPFEVAVKLSKGGSQADREQFLQDLDTVAESLALYYVLTPERSYQDVNVTRYEVSRHGAQGAYFLTEVEVFFVEIRQTTPQYASTNKTTQNAQDPDAKPPVNQGSVSPLRKTHLRAPASSSLQSSVDVGNLDTPGHPQ